MGTQQNNIDIALLNNTLYGLKGQLDVVNEKLDKQSEKISDIDKRTAVNSEKVIGLEKSIKVLDKKTDQQKKDAITAVSLASMFISICTSILFNLFKK
jgi:hypothetical protein